METSQLPERARVSIFPLLPLFVFPFVISKRIARLAALASLCAHARNYRPQANANTKLQQKSTSHTVAQRTAHSTWPTAQSTQCTANGAQHKAKSTHCRPHKAQSTQHKARSKTTQSTDHTTQSTQQHHTKHNRVHNTEHAANHTKHRTHQNCLKFWPKSTSKIS